MLIFLPVKFFHCLSGLPTVPSEPAEDDEDHQRKSEILKVWKYCCEQSRSVEVLYENLDGEKVLSKVHFQYDPDVSAAVH